MWINIEYDMLTQPCFAAQLSSFLLLELIQLFRYLGMLIQPATFPIKFIHQYLRTLPDTLCRYLELLSFFKSFLS